jgi:hypothetical protein
VPGGEVDARTTITIEVEWSRPPVIVEKRTNGARQMHAEGPIYMQAHFDLQRNASVENIADEGIKYGGTNKLAR